MAEPVTTPPNHDEANLVTPEKASERNSTTQNLRLSEVKKMRKQIETDAQLLANRVALLQQEEIRTHKKIAETKKKANEIMKKKKTQEKKYEEKIKNNQDNNQLLTHTQTLKFNRYKSQLENIRKTKEQLREENKKNAERIKNERKMNENKVEKIKKQIKNKNQERKAMIKFKEQIGKQNKDLQKDRLLHKNKKNYEKRIGQEQAIIAKREKDLMKIEALEKELIGRLAGTQNEQKGAFDQLESALNYEVKKQKSPAKQNSNSFDRECSEEYKS